MMKYLLFILLILTRVQASAEALELKVAVDQMQDTLDDKHLVDAKIIDEIIETKKTPSKDKVQYFSQLTKYGFKNLFKQYRYNSSLPYSSQVNPNAEVYMQDYLRAHTASLEKMKVWGMPYFNLIDNIFMQYGLPKELKYLAVIESNLNTSATSWVGAGGPWQFMPYTARDYGLVVNGSYDERRDYLKSTHAAARYLLALYKEMPDWLLVIAAYNGGPGRVYSAMKKSGSKDFWSLQYFLPQESRNHVKKFIATHYIMEGNQNFTQGSNISLKNNPGIVANPYSNRSVLSAEERSTALNETISGKFNSSVIAKNLEMDLALFNKYNPDFNNQLGMTGQYDLLLPADKMQIFLANKYHILNECVQLLLTDNAGYTPPVRTVYPKRTLKRK